VAWIETTREDEWDGELADLHGKLVDRDHGRVDNIMQIHSLDPPAMEGHLGVYNAAMSSTRTLRKVERELIALVVSDINDCHY
jgi:alkylhydroperoxidase family enzyme